LNYYRKFRFKAEASRNCTLVDCCCSFITTSCHLPTYYDAANDM